MTRRQLGAPTADKAPVDMTALDLQAWCDQRNATLVQRSRDPNEEIEWRVVGRDPFAKAVLRWKTTKEPAQPPYCTPAEARAILREHPSSFARSLLAAIEARDRR